MISLFIAAALLLPPPDTSPPRRTGPDGQIYLDSPAPPELRSYEFRAELTSWYEGSFDERLAAELRGEPYEIVSYDAGTGRAVVRTTDWGGLALSGMRRSLDISDMSPRVDRIERRCTEVMARLPHPDTGEAFDHVFGSVVCPPATRLVRGESIVVEGQNAEGERLWVTATQDPRLRFVNESDFASIYDAMGAVSVRIAVPISDDLVRLRWYRLNDYGDLSGLGETLWQPAPSGH